MGCEAPAGVVGREDPGARLVEGEMAGVGGIRRAGQAEAAGAHRPRSSRSRRARRRARARCRAPRWPSDTRGTWGSGRRRPARRSSPRRRRRRRAAGCREPPCRGRRAWTRPPRTSSSPSPPSPSSRGWADCRALLHRRRHDRLPQIVVRRDRRHQVPGDLGGVSGSRQEAQGQGPPARTDPRPHGRRRPCVRLSLPVVLGRPRGRGRRQDRQAQHERDHRVGQVHDRLLEGGRTTRAASPGTTPTTIVPSCPARSAPR